MPILPYHRHFALGIQILDGLVHIFNGFMEPSYFVLGDSSCVCHGLNFSPCVLLLLRIGVVAWVDCNRDTLSSVFVFHVGEDEGVLATLFFSVESENSLVFASARVDHLVVWVKNEEIDQLLVF